MELKQYISYIIIEPTVEKQEILIAELSDYGFDGFEQNETGITATGLTEGIQTTDLTSYLSSQNIQFTTQAIEEQNWNAQWERSFEPIVIENFCAVRAAFHTPVAGVPYEIIITPKMSFGTGHHATTYMMLQAMQQIDFQGKSVIDFGTGTGILTILAEKLGAKNVDAVDYDDWCIENGRENIEANNCSYINLVQASNLDDVQPAEVILANINKHIILSNMASMKAKLTGKNGMVVVSGILKTDEQDITEAATKYGFYKQRQNEKNGWLCICFGFI